MKIKNIATKKKLLILPFVCISILLMPFYARANNSIIIKGSVSNASNIPKDDLENSIIISGMDKNGEKIDVHLMLDNNLFYQIELPEDKAETLFKCKNALSVSSSPSIKQPYYTDGHKYWDIIKNSNGKYILSLRIFNIPCKKYKLELKWENEFLSDKPCLDYELDFNLRYTSAKLLKEYNLPDTSENLIKNAEQYKIFNDHITESRCYSDKHIPKKYIYGGIYEISVEQDIEIDLPDKINVKYKLLDVTVRSNLGYGGTLYKGKNKLGKKNIINYKSTIHNYSHKDIDEIVLSVYIKGCNFDTGFENVPYKKIYIKLDKPLKSI